MFIGFNTLFVFAIKWTAFYVIAVMFLFRAIHRQVKEKNKIENIKASKINIYLLLISYTVTFLGYMLTENSFKCFDFTDTYMNTCLNKKSLQPLNDIADYLDENDPDASIFAIFEQSNYFEFRGYKVYSDARPELYTKEIAGSDDISVNVLCIQKGYNVFLYKENTGIFSSSDENNLVNSLIDLKTYKAVIDSINTDYFVVNKFNTAFWYYLETSDDYTFIMDSGQFALYLRQ
jgi:hypothetical protein